MPVPTTPSRIRVVEVNGEMLHLRRPDRAELGDIVQYLESAQQSASGAMNLRTAFERNESDTLARLAVRACVRDDADPNSPDPVLSEDDALEWAYEAMLDEDAPTIVASELVSMCLRLCGMGSFAGKDRR